MARPSKYDTHVKPMMNAIKGWARDGLTDEQIARNLDIATSTFYKYKKEYIELSEALNTNKAEADYEVENNLYKTANGFYYTEEVYRDGEIVELKKYQPPNTTAQIFWLKNRQPHKWRDQQTIEHSGAIDTNPLKDLSTEELRAIAKQAKGDK